MDPTLTSAEASERAARELAHLRAQGMHPKTIQGSGPPAVDPWQGTGTQPCSYQACPRTGVSTREAPVDVSWEPGQYQGYGYCPAPRNDQPHVDWFITGLPWFNILDIPCNLPDELRDWPRPDEGEGFRKGWQQEPPSWNLDGYGGR